MPKRYRNNLTREELDRGIIPTNHVLVEMESASAEGAKTKAGIVVGFLEDDTFAEGGDSHTADLAQVYGKVYRVPERLYFNPDDGNAMPWDCDMEVCEDDTVWFDIIEAKNAVEIECEDKVYRFIPYASLYVATREVWVDKWSVPQKKKTVVIPLNGFVLLEPVNKKALGDMDVISENILDPTKGIIRYIGTPNKRYLRPFHTDIEDLRVGDLVLFEAKTPIIFLERKAYLARFQDNELFIVVQRRRLAMVLNR